MRQNWNQLETIAAAEVKATLAALPEPLRVQAQKLAITLARVPGHEFIAEGIAADTLGLFTGPEFAEEEHSPMPPQIILYLENIWDSVAGDEGYFRNEVRTTFLHELGHYLGLDEDELAARGLQ